TLERGRIRLSPVDGRAIPAPDAWSTPAHRPGPIGFALHRARGPGATVEGGCFVDLAVGTGANVGVANRLPQAVGLLVARLVCGVRGARVASRIRVGQVDGQVLAQEAHVAPGPLAMAVLPAALSIALQRAKLPVSLQVPGANLCSLDLVAL